MQKEEFRVYFNHVLGLTLLNIWCKKHDVLIKNKLNIINIPAHKANLFKVGLPIYEKNIFLALEREESNWMKRIVFNRVMIDPVNKNFILITQRIEGDKELLPDITEIGIIIPYFSDEKINFFKNEKFCCLKEFYVEDGILTVSKDNFFRIPVFFMNEEKILNSPNPKNIKYFTRNELLKYTTLEDLITGNISRTNVFKTEYQGNTVNHFTDPSLNKLLHKFNIKDYENDFEKGTFIVNNELNEFSQKEYDYDADWIKKRNESNVIKSDEAIAKQLTDQWC